MPRKTRAKDFKSLYDIANVRASVCHLDGAGDMNNPRQSEKTFRLRQ
jgi:hypothetical protein